MMPTVNRGNEERTQAVGSHKGEREANAAQTRRDSGTASQQPSSSRRDRGINRLQD
ncbi:uncharacterized protein BDV14DRAFT_171541 [Aspergillus stella-maris]|uniref:uncharacterized protein n=1 Tax=Aspergillus stella-maris TaxID=1810926 RepID=UPI003CCDE97A